jgi:hypothetical protein
MGRELETGLRTARLGVIVASLLLLLAGGAGPAVADYHAGMPPGVDPGTPSYAASSAPLPAEPVGFDPRTSPLRAIFDADAAHGGTSYWIDRVLERPFLSPGDTALYTRGRALYMYAHNPAILGFAGGYAYRERPTGRNQDMYTVALSDATLAEDTAARKQYPSHWESTHAATGMRVVQRKFITYNDVAVTLLAITDTGSAPTTRTVTVSSPIATTPAAGGTELTGSVTARYGLTVVTPRLTGSGMTVSGTALTRTVTLDPGESTTVKVQMGVTASELAGSDPEYERYRDYDPQTALHTHLREYNRWWADNVPYIDVPDENVKKMSYYRTFLNRFSSTATSPATTTSSRCRSRECSATTTRSSSPSRCTCRT